ncbi:MAG TPA: ABC transporter permease [Methanothermobacter sp.]|nr:anion transport system permease protein [Methanothermobacter sp. MT-2]HOK72787.1 ABC transporter permease [Methanothermobacter sp.]HOL69677.1 ABC transporter permease [Methanothermobacter sp.]HPQ05251.1 ABC transporter permease [Methanothermobacter sp.]
MSTSRLNLFPLACRFVALAFVLMFFTLCINLWTVSDLNSILTSLISEDMIHSLKLSIITSSIATLLVIPSSIMIAYTLSDDTFGGISIVKAILDLPFAVPELLIGILLLMFFSNTPVSGILSFTISGIICAQFFVALPYAVKMCYSTFVGIDNRLKFVSRSLGYSEFETFKNIILPLSRNGILAAIIVTFSRCIGCFGAVLILGGGTYQRTDTLPVSLYLNLSYGNIDMSAASGIFLMIIAFLTIFAIEKMGVNDVIRESGKSKNGSW